MTKTFHYGDFTFKGYFVKAGKGWEIGYKFNNKTYFVSNFINHGEAQKWWTLSHKVIRDFSKTEFYPNMNKVFFGSFVGNYLYKNYYNFVRGVVSKHYQVSHKSYKKDFAVYNQQFKKFKAA